ncbi:MAG: hypothetical protein H7Y31_17995, partial [Chitinophagaceae bacterium]|nr:hypothetical protein [Chitinophagaceae bacterium]
MKKQFLLASAFSILAFVANSQIKKGSTFLGGTISASVSKTDQPVGPDLKNNSFVFSPAIGKAVRDNFIVGGELSFQSGKNENNFYDTEQTGFGAGVFIRQYKTLGKGFYLFGQGKLGGFYRNHEVDNKTSPMASYEQKDFGVEANFYPGISYAVTNKLHIEAVFNNLAYIQYSTSKTEDATGTESTTNGFSIGTSLSNFGDLGVGVRF